MRREGYPRPLSFYNILHPMKKYKILLLLTPTLFVGCAVSHSQTKARPELRVEHFPYDPTLHQKEIAGLLQGVKNDPQSALSTGQLALAYLKRYAETGDLQSALNAERTARRSLQLRVKRNEVAMLALAKSLVAQHRFSDALPIVQGMLKHDPANSSTQLFLAENYFEMGDYDKAKEIWSKRDASRVSSYSKAFESRLRWLNGDPEKSLKAIEAGLELADREQSTSPEALAWFYEKTGERYESMGRLDEAEKCYQSALKSFPKDFHSLNGLARLSLSRMDWAQALKWAQTSSAIVPAPETLAIIGDAHLHLGNRAAAKKYYALIDSISRLAKSKGDTYDRQRALFLADHDRNLPEALEMAQNEMRVRHDIYSYDTLAWTLCKAGRLVEAQSAMQKALAYGTKDSRILYHASRIEAGLHNAAKAQEYTTRMTRANPNLYVFGEPLKIAFKETLSGTPLPR